MREDHAGQAGATVVSAFLAAARRDPDRAAVVAEAATTTYGELAGLAAAIQRQLLDHRIGPGDRVGVYARRGVLIPAALLAVLATGAVYVPLDPGYPAERTEFMRADSAVRLVLCDPDSAAAAGDPAEVLMATSPGEHALVEVEVPAAAGAYVIYTSGTTGRPKGALVSRAAVGALLASSDQVFDFDAQDTWTWLHSHCFDFSIWEILTPLRLGARLVVVDQEAYLDSAELLRLLVRERVSVFNAVPTLFKYLVRAAEADPADLSALRYVIFGGEAFDKDSVSRWRRLCSPRLRMVNMYGLTEATVHVTVTTLGERDLDGSVATTNIGKPLPHLSCAVVDEHLRPVPTGTPGELYVSGTSLATEYLNQPELTDQRFPRLALDGLTPQRWYRTGDQVVGDEAGQLHYIGRLDDQVSLRGHRIELAEIEAVLAADAAVADVAVIVRHMANGEPVLVAFVVPADGADPLTLPGLRRICSATLPSYMIPNLLVTVDDLPVSPTGKIDKKALAAR